MDTPKSPEFDESTPKETISENTGELLSEIDALRESWPGLHLDARHEVFKRLSRTDAEELFLNLTAADQAELISVLLPPAKRSWIRLLPPDDAADLIQSLSDEQRYEALGLLDEQTRKDVTALLAYAEDDAGGLMNSQYVRLRPDMSVDEAIRYLRAQAKTPVETIYYAYVLDAEQRLLGVVSFRELFLAPTEKKVKEIMKTDLITIPEDMDQEEVGRLVAQHDLMAVPVVDKSNHMKGIVTVDDVVTVVEEEATEDIQKMGGTEALEQPYLKIGFFKLLKKRAGWLTVLFLGEMFTATAMGHYEKELERAIILALFIPLIISSGGNSGSQASTLIIRAIALREIRLRDWWRVLVREVGSGLFLGLMLGVIGIIRIVLTPNRESVYGQYYLEIAATVSISLVGVVLWGATAGSMLPFILRRFKLDPASASAPLVATLVDVTGLVIYFSTASLILGGKLL